MLSRSFLLPMLCIVGGALGAGCGGSVGDSDPESGSGATGGTTGASTGGSGVQGGATGSSTGGRSMSITGGAGATSPGGGAANTGGTTSGGSALPELCGLPFEAGHCDAVIPVYWHDPETGLCIPEEYGGCGGNDNRFESLGQCHAACEGSLTGGDLDLCWTHVDCALTPRFCCGGCDPATDRDWVALRADAVEVFRNHIGCVEVQCEQCLPVPPVDRTRRYFYPACDSGRCVLRDLRSGPLTGCMVAADCRLRCGTGCCTSCNPEDVVAILWDTYDVEEFCGGGLLGCDDCACDFPESVTAECVSNRCVVGHEPVCTPGFDFTCNAEAIASWISGTCNEDGTCTCAEDRTQDPRTGLCR